MRSAKGPRKMQVGQPFVQTTRMGSDRVTFLLTITEDNVKETAKAGTCTGCLRISLVLAGEQKTSAEISVVARNVGFLTTTWSDIQEARHTLDGGIDERVLPKKP